MRNIFHAKSKSQMDVVCSRGVMEEKPYVLVKPPLAIIKSLSLFQGGENEKLNQEKVLSVLVRKAM